MSQQNKADRFKSKRWLHKAKVQKDISNLAKLETIVGQHHKWWHGCMNGQNIETSFRNKFINHTWIS